MNEICKTCPIKSGDQDSSVLCEIAAELSFAAGVGRRDDSYIANLGNIVDVLEESDLELAQAAIRLSDDGIEKARLCAQKILWNSCEFALLEQDS